MRFDFRARGVAPLVVLVLAVSALVGIVASRLVEHGRAPLEQARSLARSGHYMDAEHEYLTLAQRRPVSVPNLIELLDNHALVVAMSSEPDDASGPLRIPPAARPPSPEALEGPIDAVLAAPDLPAHEALLARWWRQILRNEPNEKDRAAVVAAADADPPLPWANHLLGREASQTDEDSSAAERFAREATAFDDRRGDATAACRQWIDDENWDRLATALASPRFARQVGADVRMDEALQRRDWRGAARWFFPSQYEGATIGIVLLAASSGLVWFGICALIGQVAERPRVRAPLYLAAFFLGVGSTYLTLAIAIVEQRLFAFTEKGEAIVDLIYFVVGVGLREELSKALLLLALIPIVTRWGRRREALACGALVGLGFAAEENLGYFHMGLSTALSRFLTANFLHVSTTGLVAVAIDDAIRRRETRQGDLSRTLMLVVAAHGLYDFFLSKDGSSFLSMFVFILLARRFVGVLRSLPGREGPLLRWFLVGLALVAGASFVYASVLVGPQHAATSLLEGMLGVAIVTYVFVQELRTV